MWLVTPKKVITVSTKPSAATWMGMTNVSAGISAAPISDSHGWKLIAAHAVGGRLSWCTL